MLLCNINRKIVKPSHCLFVFHYFTRLALLDFRIKKTISPHIHQHKQSTENGGFTKSKYQFEALHRRYTNLIHFNDRYFS